MSDPTNTPDDDQLRALEQALEAAREHVRVARRAAKEAKAVFKDAKKDRKRARKALLLAQQAQDEASAAATPGDSLEILSTRVPDSPEPRRQKPKARPRKAVAAESSTQSEGSNDGADVVSGADHEPASVRDAPTESH